MALRFWVGSAEKRGDENLLEGGDFRMAKKKNKFDLTTLVHDGTLKAGQTLYFLSDPSKTCEIVRAIGGDYKVASNGKTMTIHAFAQECLGQEPPDHASRWVRTENGKTLYEAWNDDSMAEAA
jgi:hypothetical protein